MILKRCPLVELVERQSELQVEESEMLQCSRGAVWVSMKNEPHE